MKRCNLIKRFFIGLLLIVVASISANAQEGLFKTPDSSFKSRIKKGKE